MNAKPMLNVNRLVFWVTVLLAVPALAYHYGFEAGFEKARSMPAKCLNLSPEGKALSGVQFDAESNQTYCYYIRSTYGKGKWRMAI